MENRLEVVYSVVLLQHDKSADTGTHWQVEKVAEVPRPSNVVVRIHFDKRGWSELEVQLPLARSEDEHAAETLALNVKPRSARTLRMRYLPADGGMRFPGQLQKQTQYVAAVMDVLQNEKTCNDVAIEFAKAVREEMSAASSCKLTLVQLILAVATEIVSVYKWCCCQ